MLSGQGSIDEIGGNPDQDPGFFSFSPLIYKIIHVHVVYIYIQVKLIEPLLSHGYFGGDSDPDDRDQEAGEMHFLGRIVTMDDMIYAYLAR